MRCVCVARLHSPNITYRRMLSHLLDLDGELCPHDDAPGPNAVHHCLEDGGGVVQQLPVYVVFLLLRAVVHSDEVLQKPPAFAVVPRERNLAGCLREVVNGEWC